MLIFNKALAKARKKVDICFLQVKYLPSKAISAIFTKKVNTRLWILQLSNILIWAVKIVDVVIIKLKILKY